MKKLLVIAFVLGVICSIAYSARAATILFPLGGGTGTSSPSGILYGTNANSPLQTVIIGPNLTFTAGTLSATAGSGTFPFAQDTNYGAVVYSTSTPTLWFKSGFFASSTNSNAGLAIGASSSGRALQVINSGTGPGLWMQQTGTNAFLITAIAKTENANAIDIAHNPDNPTLATTKTFSLANNNNARGILALFTNSGTNKGFQVDQNDTTDWAAVVNSVGFGLKVISGNSSNPFTAQSGNGVSTSTVFQITSAGVASTTNLTISGLGSGSTQCLHISGTGVVSGTASDCGSGGSSFAYPFVTATDFNVTTQSTTTAPWFKAGLFASSTAPDQVWVDQLDIGSTTAGTLATSTDYGNFVIKGNASTSALYVGNLGGAGNSIVIARASGLLDRVGLPLAVANGGTGISAPGTNQLVYANGAGVMATVATSTVSLTGPLNGAITAIGASNSLGWSGLATSSAGVIGNIPYFTSASALGNTATGTITCAGTASCGTGSYVLGANLTITGTGAGSGLATTTADYIIYNQGTLTKALKTITNTVISSNSSADVVLRAAIADATSSSPMAGNIYVAPGTYYLYATTSFIGLGTNNDYTFKIWGSTQASTTFVVMNNSDGFYLTNRVKVDFRNFAIALTGAANGIVSHSGASGDRSVWNSNFDGLYIFSTSTTATGKGFLMGNDYRNTYNNIQFYQLAFCFRSYAEGNGLNNGDSIYSNIMCDMQNNTTASSTAFDFDGTANSNANQVNDDTFTDVNAFTNNGNKTAWDFRHTLFMYVNSTNPEGFSTTTLILNGSQNNSIKLEYAIGSTTPSQYFTIDSTSFDNSVNCGYIDSYNAAHILFTDGNTDAKNPNIFQGQNGQNCTLRGSGTYAYATTSASIIRDIESNGLTYLEQLKALGDRIVFNFASGADQFIASVGSLLEFNNNGHTAITIDSAGDVGINNTAPAAQLDVNGASVFGNNGWVTQTTGGFWLDSYNSFGVGYYRDATGNAFMRTNNTVRMSQLNTGEVGFATSTPQWPLTSFSSTQPQLALSAGAGLSQWTFRNAGGVFYLATTTTAGTATSTKSALTIDTNGIPAWSALGGVTGCAQFDSTGKLSNTGTACGTGGGTSAFEIATSTGLGTSQLTYISQASGRTTLASVATTSVTCSGLTTCTSFTVIGSSPITISSTGGVGSSQWINNGSDIYYSGGRVGIGTSSPFAMLSIHATSTDGVGAPTDLFTIASSSQGTATTTIFNIDNKGNITLAQDGTPSTRSITVNAQQTIAKAGNRLNIKSGIGSTTGTGGILDVRGGAGGSTGAGGALFMFGGAAGTSGNADGGLASLSGGDAAGSGTGGAVSHQGGQGGASAGTGGNITLTGGTAGAGGNGGLTTLQGGAVNGGNGIGGSVAITGRPGAGSGNGGGITITAGKSGASGGNGGDIVFLAGDNMAAGGTQGTFKFKDPLSLIQAVLDTASLATSDKTFTFPNSSGTFCLTTTCAAFAYPFPAFSGIGTTTGLILSASTTIGAGGAATGLTIDGDATSTGNINLTSTGFVRANNQIIFGGNGFNTLFRPDSSGGDMQFQSFAGGTNVTFQDGGKVGIGTTTPRFPLSVFNATAPQISLAGGTTDAPWDIRSIGGFLYLATSSPSTFATTTVANTYMTIDPAGRMMIGTTTATGQLNLGTLSSSKASTTIHMGKLQFDGLNTGGAPTCVLINAANALVVVATACNP